jgi:hypothetical protein
MNKYLLIIFMLVTFMVMGASCKKDDPHPEQPGQENPKEDNSGDTDDDDPDDGDDDGSGDGNDNPDDGTDGGDDTNDGTDPDDGNTDDGGNGNGDPGDDGGEEPVSGMVPADKVGKWMNGVFSISNFWNYDGSYAGKPLERATVFDFKANGEYEQYVIFSMMNYSCRTESFTYMKGTVTFNPAEKSFTVTPASGNYRGFYSCAPSSNFQRDAKPDELKVQTFYYDMVQQDGKTYMVVKHAKDDQYGSYFQPTSW